MMSQLDMFGGGSDGKGARPDPKPRRERSASIPSASSLSEEDMARLLENTGRYHILRRLEPEPVVSDPRPGFPFIAAIVDTETTGLRKTDEIIEIGIVCVRFDSEGRLGDVISVYGALQQPSGLIPPEITVLTGIDDDMVRGQSIDLRRVEELIGSADLVIAHNAGFDRPFCERLSPVFASRAWACSNSEIDWKVRGFEGTKLGYLLGQSGLFHDGHRAIDDCYALLEILGQPDDKGQTAFAEFYASSQKTCVRLWADTARLTVRIF